jgi:predicted CXXCH cytochrome family protein
MLVSYRKLLLKIKWNKRRQKMRILNAKTGLVWLLFLLAVFGLGVFEGRFFSPAYAMDLVEADCRCCHGTTLADRHHLLVPSRNLECMTCHQMVVDPGTSTISTVVQRDCKLCHTASQADRHHLLTTSGAYDCFSCHSVVPDPLTGNLVVQFNKICTPAPTPSGSITGFVGTAAGAGIGGAKVATTDGKYSTFTTSSGNYQLDKVLPGSYLLETSKSGFTSVRKSVTAVGGQTKSVNFALSPLVSTGTISGVVTDSGGTPLGGATITTDLQGYKTLTSATGNYTLPGVVAGSYKVTAGKSGFLTATVTRTVSANQTVAANFMLTAPEVCTDGLDNDGDGRIDCADADCSIDAHCAIVPEVCNNGLDDDGDSFFDCADSDCTANPVCAPAAEVCTNGLDDDGDGLVDCLDSDCSTSSACMAPPVPEICFNTKDDDLDGLIDCADPDCAGTLVCGSLNQAEICSNGLDDDGDNLIDCADADCAGFPFCAVEVCDNGKDDDLDGLIDCADPECGTAAKCGKVDIKGPEICNNKLDDDKDGAIDCRDRDCRKNPACRIPKYDWKHIRETSRVTTGTSSTRSWWLDRFRTWTSGRYSSGDSECDDEEDDD